MKHYRYLHHDQVRVAALCAALAALAMGAPACSNDAKWPTTEQLVGHNRISSTFGPRELGDGDATRYDFHRGLDLPVPYGSRAQAMMPGTVRVAGDNPGYGDDTIQLVHCLDDEPPADLLEHADACDALYYTHYSHLSEILVASGTHVDVGDVIGLTGTGGGGVEHIHIEFRHGDTEKANAIHPLLMLSYDNLGPPALSIDEVDGSDPGAIEVAVTVSVPASQVDVNRVEVELYALDSGEVVAEQHFDYMGWNQTFEDEDLDDDHFNGVLVVPEEFTRTSVDKVVHFRFRELASSLPAEQYGVVARASDIKGQSTQVNWTPQSSGVSRSASNPESGARPIPGSR